MDDNPSKYMHFSDEKILYIKNECSETWIDYEDWINRALQEEFYLTHEEKSCIITGGKIPIKGVLISCEECGAKVDNQKIYCWKCGNLLPLV